MALDGKSIFNSGMLVSLDAFNAVGGYDEKIPLDFADHDFCRRFARIYCEIYILDLSCEHGFSNLENSSIENALMRFSFYCRGARNSCKSPMDKFSHLLVVLVRCIVLSLRYRSFRFLPIIMRNFHL
jgi:GT2 family glycosyltransferase